MGEARKSLILDFWIERGEARIADLLFCDDFFAGFFDEMPMSGGAQSMPIY